MTGLRNVFHMIMTRKKNHFSGDLIDHSIIYYGKDQRCLPRCLLGPAEAAHLDQKAQLHQLD